MLIEANRRQSTIRNGQYVAGSADLVVRQCGAHRREALRRCEDRDRAEPGCLAAGTGEEQAGQRLSHRPTRDTAGTKGRMASPGRGKPETRDYMPGRHISIALYQHRLVAAWRAEAHQHAIICLVVHSL